ncbi:MAG: hypothetical protein MI861_07605 [Pirellulales bacterium]|nr:hypothetical protein [Pirellulales bacterium]
MNVATSVFSGNQVDSPEQLGTAIYVALRSTLVIDAETVVSGDGVPIFIESI